MPITAAYRKGNGDISSVVRPLVAHSCKPAAANQAAVRMMQRGYSDVTVEPLASLPSPGSKQAETLIYNARRLRLIHGVQPTHARDAATLRHGVSRRMCVALTAS